MKKGKKVLLEIAGVVLAGCVIAGGCSLVAGRPIKGMENTVSKVEEIQVPEEVRIVGLGEATHGNKEFIEVRKTVLEQLAKNQGFNLVVLEGDFGGCKVVNDFVVSNKGSAKEAVLEIGFSIYKTQEMVDFIQWIDDYNQNLEESDKIHFAGCDLQRYDNNKDYLFAYLDKVDAGLSKEYQEKLSALTDETTYTESDEVVRAGLKEVQNLMKTMEEKKTDYVKASTLEEYDTACELANTLQENATIQGTNVPYANTRDNYMAQKVQWIYNFENQQRDTKMLLIGHNGHIEKSSASVYTGLGDHLKEAFGKEYFAIGTEYGTSIFTAQNTAGEYEAMTVKNGKSCKLAYALQKMNTDIAYLDFANATKNDKVNKMIHSTMRMGSIGAQYNPAMSFFSASRTLKQVPAVAYDAVIFVKNATPTTILE